MSSSARPPLHPPPHPLPRRTRFQPLIPDTSVFRFVAGAAARFPEFRFAPAEAASLAHLDGRRTVGEIVSRTSPLDFLHALYAGACMDLLRGV